MNTADISIKLSAPSAAPVSQEYLLQAAGDAGAPPPPGEGIEKMAKAETSAETIAAPPLEMAEEQGSVFAAGAMPPPPEEFEMIAREFVDLDTPPPPDEFETIADIEINEEGFPAPPDEEIAEAGAGIIEELEPAPPEEFEEKVEKKSAAVKTTKKSVTKKK